jgi:phenylalanine-4-hydroxylase
LTSAAPRRVAFDLVRVMRSRYRIDAYQETYFVVDSFQQLFDATRPTTPSTASRGPEDLPADAPRGRARAARR